jgi:hypothetical protein
MTAPGRAAPALTGWRRGIALQARFLLDQVTGGGRDVLDPEDPVRSRYDALIAELTDGARERRSARDSVVRGLRAGGLRNYESALADLLELRALVLTRLDPVQLRPWVPLLRGDVKRLVNRADPFFDGALALLDRLAAVDTGTAVRVPAVPQQEAVRVPSPRSAP